MDKKKDIIIKIEDKCDFLEDRLNMKSIQRNKIPVQGRVEIFEVDDRGKKQLLDKSNLVVYLGREWLATRIFRTNNAQIDPYYDQFISWFGLGDGGCPEGDPFDPTAPTNNDTDLANPVMINATDSTCGDYRVTPEVGYYKLPFDSVTFEQDPSNDNAYLITRLVITVGADDANGKILNEAGLFVAVDSGGPFYIFSRVTFPSISKTSDRQLIFVWYIYT